MFQKPQYPYYFPCLFLFGICFASAETIPGLFPTGVDANGQLLSSGSIDPHYLLVESADSNYPGPNTHVVHDAHPIGAWMAHGPNSKWIAPRETASNAGGQYTYQTTFDLTGFDPSTAVLTGQWSHDNAAVDIKINGVSTGQTFSGGFTNFEPFSVNQGFVEGSNTLEFTINNNGSGSTGIRIELSGSADLIGNAPPQTQREGEPLGPSRRRSGLAFSEVHYHPLGTQTEFIELYNSNPWAEPIEGFQIKGDISFTFPAGTTIPANGFLVVASTPAAYPGALGPWKGSLPDSGGTLRLVKRSGGVILDLNYEDHFPWPIAADGSGHSMVLAHPSLGENDPNAWAQSSEIGGSPFADEAGADLTYANLCLNEILANASTDFLELYNRGPDPIDLSGCVLTDDPEIDRFVIADGTTINGNRFLSFDSATLGFGLSAAGETLYLKNPDGSRVIDSLRFGAQLEGISFGRQPDGNPHQIGNLTAPTPGTQNAQPLISEIVINEIMFHPIHADGSEYVELFNRGSLPIDLSGWAFTEGLDFSFPAGTIIPAGGFVVVAADQDHLLADHPQLDGSLVFGNFGGSLSDRGERIVLSKPMTTSDGLAFAEVDSVHYSDSNQWGKFTDGGGSSLELIDPHADNRFGTHWAGSDESSKASWTVIDHTGLLEHGKPGADETPKQLQVFLQDEGEALLDDVVVKPAGGSNRVVNPDFSGTNAWFFQGTHSLSTIENGALHIRATSRGDLGPNRIRTPLSSALTIGQEGTIQGRARWLGGTPYLLMRLFGNHLEAPIVLEVPRNLGTPGASNSHLVTNAPPAIIELQHEPLAPASNQDVLITARAQDPDGLARMTLSYRIDPSSSLSTSTMVDDGTQGDLVAGDGVFSALITGRSTGTLVAFQVHATDSLGMSAQAPQNEGLIRWGDGNYPGSFATYRLWMTEATHDEWVSREAMSNLPLPVTFIYNDTRAIYDAGAQYSGSAFSSPQFTTPTAKVAGIDLFFPGDQKILGEDRMILDYPVRDETLQREQLMYWFLDQFDLPNHYRRWVNVFINGKGQRQRAPRGLYSNSICTDIQQPSSDSVDEWFDGQTNGMLVKGTYWLEFDNNGNMYRTLPRQPTLDVVNSASGEKHLAAYRWYWRPRALKGSSPNDLTHIFNLSEALNTPGPSIVPAVHANVDIDQWMRTFAVNDCAANWDAFGTGSGKNSWHYRPPNGRWQIISWDLDVGLGVANNATNRALSNPSDASLDRVYATPSLRRHYWHALREAVESFFQVSAVTPVLEAKAKALQDAGVPFVSPFAPSGQENLSITDWIDERRDYLLGQLANVEAPFAITTNNGANFTTSVAPVILEGTAPTTVHSLALNGRAVAFEWTGVNSWKLQAALPAGTHTLVINGLNRSGATLDQASDQITIQVNSGTDQPAGNLVINEIMYHPNQPDAEYLELHNRSTSTAFDLSGWKINGLGLTLPTGTTVAPGGFLVVAQNLNTFGSTYGWTIPDILPYSASLDNRGETLTLLNQEGEVMDQVNYSPNLPWPLAAAGAGPSLQLKNPLLDNSRASNWSASQGDAGPLDPLVEMTAHWHYNQNGFVSNQWNQVGFDESSWPSGDALLYVESSALPAPKNTPLSLGPTTYYFLHRFNHTGPAGGSLALSTILDDGAIVYLNGAEIYRVRLPEGEINSSILATPAVDNAALEGPFIIPTPSLVTGENLLAVEVHQSVANSSDLVMGIELTQTGSFSVEATPGAPNATSSSLADEAPALWLNEIQTSNANTISDNAGDFEPWVEIYNASSSTLSLEGWFLSDDPAQLDKWQFPSSKTIESGSFQLIWLDNEPSENTATDLHASFMPSTPQGSLLLSYKPTGANQPRLIDALNYTQLTNAQSMGHFPDGKPAAQTFSLATPGAPNDPSVPKPLIYINEWMANNQSMVPDPADGDFDDWFELYNASAESIDLSGYTLTDDLSNPSKFVIPAGIHIAGGGFLMVWADDESSQTSRGLGLHVNFKLSGNGESIGLFTPDGTLVDSVSFGAQSDNQSQGRWPDGQGEELFTQSSPTPGTGNDLTPEGALQLPSPMLSQSGGNLAITFQTEFGRYYTIQHSTELEAGTWSNVTEAIPGLGQEISLDLPWVETRSFFRIAITRTP